LIVILTIIMIVVAYTVPPMWSKVLQRDRDKQTLFVMKQYARSIKAFQTAHGGTIPVSLDQLKEARKPRVVRGVNSEWVDPLTGKVDWILVPPSAIQNAGPGNIGGGNPAEPGYNPSPQNTAYKTDTTNTTNTNASQQAQPGKSPKDYVGPFVGVRPNREGTSYILVNGSDKYENWLYTTQDLKGETDAMILGTQPQMIGGKGPADIKAGGKP